ncbi:hypothetical protein V6N13_014912 [Hibiscus sabdariffa]|uniref:DUF7903 domain-containing protein n=2 Tax=Hibiscus sabdariffa TaxID=183260 RepID=A0ABR1ZFS6_9ROSI
MAYIPPHKRYSKDSEKPTPMPPPTPASLNIPRFNRTVQLRASRSNIHYRSGRTVYSNYATPRWFAVGLDDGIGAHLIPISVDYFERRTVKNLLILVKDNLYKNEAKECPCSSIVENVLPDLLSSFEKATTEIKSGDSKDVKRTVVARIGKILFQGQGSPSVNLESVSKDCLRETTLRKLKRTFYTILPDSYTANIIAEVAMKIGFDFAGVKDSYQLKVELNPVRDMVKDLSCLDMDLDFRLSLTHKRIVTSLPEDEMQSIRNLIDSAVLDPDVKGRFRWTFGKASCGNRYNVVAVWHAKATVYENASIRLRVSASNEVVLKLKGIVSGLQEQDVEANAISDMLKDNLSLIWRHFLRCEPFLT